MDNFTCYKKRVVVWKLHVRMVISPARPEPSSRGDVWVVSPSGSPESSCPTWREATSHEEGYVGALRCNLRQVINLMQW
jgi:hypothetical protein